MNRYLLPILAVAAMAMLAACQPLETPTAEMVSTPTPRQSLNVVTPTTTPEVVDTRGQEQDSTPKLSETPASATTAPAATPTAKLVPETLPTPSLFDVTWQERSIFQMGLVGDAQSVLEGLPGATVYHMVVEIGEDLVSLEGQQEVLYSNREDVDLNEIYFRLYPNLTGGSIEVSGLSVNGTPVTPTYGAADSALRVPLPQPMSPGEQVVVGMDFAVRVPTDESSNYGTFAFLDQVLALAHFYPQVAVYDDEGWNVEVPSPQGDIVYADASFYLVQLMAPADMVVATSGVVLENQEEGERQTLRIAAGPARDFYVAASEDYVVVSETFGGTTVNSYAFPNLSEGAELALEVAAASLQRFEELFGPYPLTELDLVGTATSALGVEYPGIMALTNRIYDGDGLRALEGTTAHEVAHQWFYNVVGNDQVDEPWLDEALAQYATLRYFEAAYGDVGYEAFRQSLTGRWERVEGADIPIGLPVSSYEGREYGAIVYGRGPLFLEELETTMGRETFTRFLQDYYQSQQWEIATTESFKALAEKHCGCDLTPLFQAWVYPPVGA